MRIPSVGGVQMLYKAPVFGCVCYSSPLHEGWDTRLRAVLCVLSGEEFSSKYGVCFTLRIYVMLHQNPTGSFFSTLAKVFQEFPGLNLKEKELPI